MDGDVNGHNDAAIVHFGYDEWAEPDEQQHRDDKLNEVGCHPVCLWNGPGIALVVGFVNHHA